MAAEKKKIKGRKHGILYRRNNLAVLCNAQTTSGMLHSPFKHIYSLICLSSRDRENTPLYQFIPQMLRVVGLSGAKARSWELNLALPCEVTRIYHHGSRVYLPGSCSQHLQQDINVSILKQNVDVLTTRLNDTFLKAKF